METLLYYLKNYDNLNPEDKFTVDVLKRKSGAVIIEDVDWYWQQKKQIYLNESSILSLHPLKSLKPEYLVLFSNRITDISPLADMESLIHLNLITNNIRFINGIEKITQLRELFIGINQITDISPLADMKNLKMLGLKQNQIKDIEPLKSLIGLVELNLSGNPITLDQVNSLKGSLPGCKILF